MNKLTTHFGNAHIKNGYYVICSRKEGNWGKLLHRLLFEEFYNIKLPSDIVIHHNDENKLNNEIWNLIPMTKEEHNILHNSNIHSQIHQSKVKSSSGLFRVCKHKNSRYKKGFRWDYQYNDEGVKKTITRVDLHDLKRAVLSKGLEWKILDEILAEKSFKEDNYDY